MRFSIFSFYYGRVLTKSTPPDRICPGRYLAINSIWLAVTHILATFTIVAGEDKDTVVEYNDGLVRFAGHFTGGGEISLILFTC